MRRCGIPNTKYDAIASDNFRRVIGQQELTNNRLREYFDSCFQTAIDQAGCYPAWVCVGCIGEGNPNAAFGIPPKQCGSCGSGKVFEIATFQSRASVVGNAFESAVRRLLVQKFELAAVPTPGNTRTHDIEITNRIAIEAKGSPRHVENPDKSVSTFARPGLERSDTWKKAQANARNFRRLNPNSPFYIVSNAVPPDLVGYRSDDVTGIFNVVQANRVKSLVEEVEAALSG